MPDRYRQQEPSHECDRDQGDDIPEHLRHPDIAMVYRVTDANGNSRYLTDDVEAAQLAVNISDRQQLKPDA